MSRFRSLDIARFWTTASKSAKAWSARKLAEFEASVDEFSARNSPAEEPPLWHLYLVLFLLLAIGGVVTAYSLTSTIAPVPTTNAHVHERTAP